MLRKVHLHGALGKKYGKVFELDVETAGEAIRAIAANFPTFLNDLREGAWHVVCGKTINRKYVFWGKPHRSTDWFDNHWIPARVKVRFANGECLTVERASIAQAERVRDEIVAGLNLPW